MLVMLSGRVTFSNFSQFIKTLSPKLVTESGMETELRLSQSPKANLPMELTLSAISTVSA